MSIEVSESGITFGMLTDKNWDHFVELFGEKGACGHCWCMYYRLSSRDYKEGTVGEGNKKAMQELVSSGKPAGLLGFIGGKAVTWCALAPREDFARIERSRVHKRIDQEKVWSVPCIFIHKEFRGAGLSGQIIRGAIKYAEENGISILEAYPLVPRKDRVPPAFAWYGFLKTFKAAGFVIVDETSKNRPMVRYYVSDNR